MVTKFIWILYLRGADTYLEAQAALEDVAKDDDDDDVHTWNEVLHDVVKPFEIKVMVADLLCRRRPNTRDTR